MRMLDLKIRGIAEHAKSTESLPSFKKLDGLLVFFRRRARLERAEVPALAGLRIFLSRI
jgi:hypothetical protein